MGVFASFFAYSPPMRVLSGFCLLVALCLLALTQVSEGIQVRAIHGIPNAPRVDVYLDGELAFRDLGFKSVSQYVDVIDSRYTVRVVRATGQVLYEIENLILRGEHATLVLHGTVDETDNYPLAISKLEDDNSIDANEARFRFYHAAAGAGSVNVALNRGVVFPAVNYTVVTPYRPIAEGYYNLGLFDLQSNPIITPLRLPFDDETVVNVYMVGSPTTETNRLTVVTVIDQEYPVVIVDSVNSSSVVAMCGTLLFVVLALLL